MHSIRSYHVGAEDEGSAWPALSDLLAATTLIFLVLFAVIAVPALQKARAYGEIANTLRSLELTVRSRDTALEVKRVGDYLRITIGGDVVFPQNRSALSDMNPAGHDRLKALAALLKEPAMLQQIDQIQVVGHTSSEGSASKNWQLSSDRAVTVAQFLINEGLPVCKVTALGRGRYYPIDPGIARTSTVPDARDRRIEVELRPVVKNDATQSRRRKDCVEMPGVGAQG